MRQPLHRVLKPNRILDVQGECSSGAFHTKIVTDLNQEMEGAEESEFSTVAGEFGLHKQLKTYEHASSQQGF